MNKKILIVDDEVDTLKLLSLRLKKIGYETTVCETGKQALATAKKESFDLAILDIKLPDTTGYDLLREIRGMPHLRKIPVIFSTADASIAVEKETKGYSANAYVIKPYDSQDLLKKMELLLLSSEDGQESALT